LEALCARISFFLDLRSCSESHPVRAPLRNCELPHNLLTNPKLPQPLPSTHDVCNTLQHTATHCNTLQHTATHCTHTMFATSRHCLAYTSVLQCVAVCCSVLQCEFLMKSLNLTIKKIPASSSLNAADASVGFKDEKQGFLEKVQPIL